MQIANQHAYLPMEGRLVIIDISNPSSPTEVGRWIDADIPRIYTSLAVEGYRLYLAIPGTLKVFDISSPRELRLLGQYHDDRVNTWNTPNSLAISGDHAYVGGQTDLDVFDVSDSRNPRWIGRTPLPERYYGSCLTIYGDYAYVTSLTGNLHVFDIRNPSSPTLVGSNYSWNGFLDGPVIVDDGRLYTGGVYNTGSGRSGALIVFDLYRPPLRLDPPESLGPEGWRLRLWGVPGETLRLQRSSDLHTWEDWRTTIGTDLPQEFIDETAGPRSRQFYRAVSP
jgi:hypothetical protein